MITPTRSALTALAPRPASPPQAPPHLEDLYTPDDPAPDRPRWVQAGLALVVVAGSTLAPMAPLAAQAAPPAVVNTKVGKVLQDRQVSRTLQQFPPEFQAQVRQMSDAQLQVLYGGVSGTTKIGPLTVNHKEAFIKGSFMGKSVWKNVKQSISDAQTKYKMISSSEARALHRIVDQAAGFTPQQRAQLTDLVFRAIQS